VVLEILAYFRIPGSKSKKLQERMRSGLVRPMKTPDVDNVMKSVQDGLNGIAYRDDRQIITASISKFYDDNPRLVVSLTYLEEVEDDV
jgi:Holliday junction resolvase RusA-like endonuclease